MPRRLRRPFRGNPLPHCRVARSALSHPSGIPAKAQISSPLATLPPSLNNEHYFYALQSLYSEIFFINPYAKRINTLYRNTGQGEFYSAGTELAPVLKSRITTVVDPEHTDIFLNHYKPERLQRLLTTNETSEAEYRKRLVSDGPYHWFSSSIVPMPDGDGVLIFLRDVSRIKEAENDFFTALQKNYGEIFIVAPHANHVRIISRFLDIEPAVPVSETYTTTLHTLAEHCVFPDDRENFINFFAIPQLQAALRKGQKVSHEYSMYGKNNKEIRIEAQVLPMPGSSSDELLVLCQDISLRRQREQEQQRALQRYNTVFRMSCDVLLEVDLTADTYTMFTFNDLQLNLPQFPSYTQLISYWMRNNIYPPDVLDVQKRRSLEALRSSTEGTRDDLTCQYRSVHADRPYWLESRIFFLHDGERNMAYNVIRDITATKELELARDQEMRRLTLALRDTYTEITELDLERQTSRPLFSYRHPIDNNTNTVYKWQDFIHSFVHPADKARVASLYNGEKLRDTFASGVTELSAEYRIESPNGDYRWTLALIIPVRNPDNTPSTKAMLFVRDISETKEQDEQRKRIEQYTQALRNIYDIFFEINLTSKNFRLIHIAENKYAFPLEDGPLTSLYSKNILRLIHPEDRTRFFAFFSPKTADSEDETHAHSMGEFRFCNAAGEYQWTSLTIFSIPHEPGTDEMWLVFGINVHAYKTTEEMIHKNKMLEQQRTADARYKIIVEQTNTLIFEHRLTENMRYFSPELALRFAGNYDGRSILQIWQQDNVIHPEDRPLFQSFAEDTGNRRHEVTIRLLQRSGSYLWCRISMTSLLDETGAVRQRIGTLNDVDEVTRSAMALRQQAERDSLTGIYNMRTFYTCAERLIRENPDREYSIIRLDIDKFKVINELYGMEEGDLLLQKIARMLHGLLNDQSVCGRISADVFCACVDLDTDGILEIVRRISDMLAVYPLPSRILPSFGICRVDNPETPINVLCDWAHLALKRIKGSAVSFHAFYDDTLRDGILKEKSIESRMHSALDLGQFQLYLQPKVHIPTGRIVGAEGLARWAVPQHSIVQPEDFIPLFEKNGFIIRLDEYIWEQTCRLLRQWINEGKDPLPISINVSRKHIHDTRLRDKVLALTDKYDLPTSMLELELTESIFLDSKNQSFAAINELRKQGFRFSLDDFGAGYSSLNILKNLPVETLKIDRGFLDEVVATERGKTIIRCIIMLAKSIDMEVVAEGVETEEQASFLVQAGCDIAQGFYYAPPMPVKEFENLVFSGKHFFC